MHHIRLYLRGLGRSPTLLLAGQHAPELLPLDHTVLVVVLLLQHLLQPRTEGTSAPAHNLISADAPTLSWSSSSGIYSYTVPTATKDCNI